MAENKKHHYVPKFYLKRFSRDGKSINLFNLASQRIIIGGNLKNQCYENYFYGKDLQAEKALSVVENLAAEILRTISESHSVPIQYSAAHVGLLYHVIMQHERTTYAADALNETIDRFVKHIMAPQVNLSQGELDKLQIGYKDPGRVSIAFTSEAYAIAIDLKCKLGLITSEEEFITSDNPVVLYNQYFEYRKLGSHTGLASKGLQIFYPIDSKHMLIYYDPDIYGVGSRKGDVVKISDKEDIAELNRLQIVNSVANVYSYGNLSNITQLYNSSRKYRREQKSRMEVFVTEETETTKREFVVSDSEDVKTGLNLSFVRILRRAKKWRETFKRQETQPAVIIRNKQLLDDYKKFRELVNKGVYKPGDFVNFLSL